MKLTYITGGRIVLPEEVVSDKALAFDAESGKIVGVVDEVPAGAETIDAKGCLVAPSYKDKVEQARQQKNRKNERQNNKNQNRRNNKGKRKLSYRDDGQAC